MTDFGEHAGFHYVNIPGLVSDGYYVDSLNCVYIQRDHCGHWLVTARYRDGPVGVYATFLAALLMANQTPALND